MFLIYMFSVLLFFVVVSSVLAVTRAGAQAEIQARGIANVGLVTHKIASGSAILKDKLLIVLMTIFGAFLSPLWLGASALISGILCFVFEISL